MITKPVLVRGHRLRDEFACPITRELMRDPVIAADGHTYDREAIEMWLRNHDTSPKAGQPMDHLFLVANHNLKRLIRDLIVEGGEALYVKEEGLPDGPDAPYRFALVPEHVLILKCLGPVESDWNGKSFRVTERGCMGGRKMPADLRGADFMHFTDATVSRSHFEIFYDRADKCFRMRDEGSAGGSFVRIPFDVAKPLYPGLMIMLGKHQLLVREASSTATTTSTATAAGAPQQRGFGGGPLELEGTMNVCADAKDGSRPATPVFPAGMRHSKNKSGSAVTEGLMDSLEHMAVEGEGAAMEDEGGADDDSVPDTTCPAATAAAGSAAGAAGSAAGAAASTEQVAEESVESAQSSITAYKVSCYEEQ
jgi:U-box domain